MEIPFKLSSLKSVEEGKKEDGRLITGPDVEAEITCIGDTKKSRVGIELTYYQNDVTNGSSPGRRLHSFFEEIWRHLEPLLRHAPDLRECIGYLRFDLHQQPRPSDAESIAKELFRFTLLHLTELLDGEWHDYAREKKAINSKFQYDFTDFSLLERYFAEIHLINCVELVGPLKWSRNSATCVGVVDKIVFDLIERKTEKLPGYDTTRTKETWLLICAGAGIPHDSAGPDHGNVRAFSKKRGSPY